MRYEMPVLEPSYANVARARQRRLRNTRKELGWTQKEMGEALDLAPSFICQMEIGNQPVSKRTDLAVRYLSSIPYKAMSHKERIANETAWMVCEGG